MKACVAIFCAIAALPAASYAQPQPPIIRGRVLAADSDRPLRRALVVTQRDVVGLGRLASLTDDDGRFEIEPMRTVSSLMVSKAGYATTRVEVKAPVDQSPAMYEIRLSKGAAISGRVNDDAGAPVLGQVVIARSLDGSEADQKWTLQVETNELGEYRIGGLAAGRYAVGFGGRRILHADAPEARQSVTTAGVESFLVDAFRGQAVPLRTVAVQAGDDVNGLDLVMTAFSPDADLRRLKASLDRARGALPAGRIVGRVVSTQGQPLSGVQVRVSNLSRDFPVSGSMFTVTTTDRSGRFSLESLADGEYRLDMNKGAHVDSDDRAPADAGPIHVVRVQQGSAEYVEMMLARGGAIAGTIVDDAGEPLQNVFVNAIRIQREHGRLVARKTGWEAVADDRGRFRVFGLSSGSYLLVASLDATTAMNDRAQNRDVASVYYPGTDLEGAQQLHVRAATEMSGIDIIVTPTRTARVAGVALDSTGEPLVGRVLLNSRESASIAVDPIVATVGPRGAFEIVGVPRGDYILQAVADQRLGRALELGSQPITVHDRDPAPITIRTSEGVTLEGRFVVEGSVDPPRGAPLIHAVTTDISRGLLDGRGPEGLVVYDDGRFYLTALHGVMSLTLFDLPRGWYLKGFSIGGVDVTDVPFDFTSGPAVGEAEVLLSPSGATIDGTVRDGPDRRAQSVVALAFSTTRGMWFEGSRFVKSRRSGANGSFSIDGLPPGDYWVVAIDRLESGDWQTPDVLDSLVPGATRVTVREGQVVSTDLVLFRP